jgi:hypothetical protein
MTTVPEFLQARAKKLESIIAVRKGKKEELDLGPFLLFCADGYHLIWCCGLPLEGIVDALNCLEREYSLPPGEDVGEAWRDFGSGWAD